MHLRFPAMGDSFKEAWPTARLGNERTFMVKGITKKGGGKTYARKSKFFHRTSNAAYLIQPENAKQNTKDVSSVWSSQPSKVLQQLQTSPLGLTTEEAKRRLSAARPYFRESKQRMDLLFLLLRQFKSPIILILITAATLSIFLHDITDAIIILSIIFISGLLGFRQEKGAADAVQKLLSLVQVTAVALRDGEPREVPVDEVVLGDILRLSAGNVVPGDCLVLDSKDCFVNEASLTGETFPVEKGQGVLPPDTPLSLRSNSLFMGK